MINIQWRALKSTKDIIISHLKMYLNNEDNYKHVVPSQLDVEDIKSADVFDVEPEELRQFPMVIITGGNGNMVTSGLGDMAHEKYDPSTLELIAYRYGGIYQFNLTIDIVTKSTLMREFMSDLITKALRFDIRRQMESKGVLVTSMNYNGETSGTYDSNHIYLTSISLSTWSEWYEDRELLPNGGVGVRYDQ
ncbi:MAG: hypothetical protein ACOCRK_01420 [bacterium]